VSRRRRRWSSALAVAIAPVLVGCQAPSTTCGSASAGAGHAAATSSGQPEEQDSPPAGYPFGATSVWRADVGAAPVAKNSRAVVRYLADTVEDVYGGIAAFNVRRYNNNLYVVPPGTPAVDVAFDDCQDKGYVPSGLTGPGGQFTAVPVPTGAVPAAGGDSTMSIYSPESDQLWEFWRIHQSPDGQWSACWGGRIDSVSENPGFFPDGFGASASGLATTGGTVSLADVRSGEINHALALVVTHPAIYKRVSWPAQRSDGWDPHPDAVPEGTRLRLDPSVDIDELRLTPVAEMVARAAQQYGFIVTDKGGAVAVTADGGAAEQATTGVDPWEAILGDVPTYEVMKNFPWEHLQALPQNYGRPSKADPRCS
jgi:hypothetical protein